MKLCKPNPEKEKRPQNGSLKYLTGPNYAEPAAIFRLSSVRFFAHFYPLLSTFYQFFALGGYGGAEASQRGSDGVLRYERMPLGARSTAVMAVVTRFA